MKILVPAKHTAGLMHALASRAVPSNGGTFDVLEIADNTPMDAVGAAAADCGLALSWNSELHGEVREPKVVDLAATLKPAAGLGVG